MEIQAAEWTESRLGWLVLAWFEGFGARTLRKLWKQFNGKGAEALHISASELADIGVTPTITKKFLEWRSRIDPEMFVRRCQRENIRFILYDDAEFPDLLKMSSDYPVTLFLRGAELRLGCPIAIVGTRSMTGYGERATEIIVADLAQAGCEIISGLALGIDAKAHQMALAASSKTIAVLPGGIDDGSIYPRHNMPLAQTILERGGTLVSEFPPGAESLKHQFLLRNRLIAALSRATVVIEAAKKSGSLITAKLALEENREVFAVPGPITSEQSDGTNTLLKLGAHPCLSGQDVLEVLEFDSLSSNVNKGECSDKQRLELSETERNLLELLSRPLLHDELIRAADLTAAEATSILITLELKGLIETQPGGSYARTTDGKRACRRDNS